MTDIPSQEPQRSPGDEAHVDVTPARGDETERVAPTRAVLQPPPVRQSAPPAGQAPRHPQASSARSRQQRRSSLPRGQQPAPPPPYAAQQPYPAPRRAPRRRSVPPSESGLYLPWWSLVVMVGVVGTAAFGLLFAFTELSRPQTPSDQPPRVLIVTSPPTLSQDFSASSGQPAPGQQSDYWPTAIPQVHPTATVPLPTPVSSPTLPPGNFSIGVRVQVVGVDASGLNVRSAPDIAAPLRFLAREGDEFVIKEGPQNADGYEWWHVEDPNDAGRFGWAARNYLTVVSP